MVDTKEAAQATARVRMTIEVYLSQPWGADETIANVQKRAAREALDRAEIAVQGRARILGVPQVEVILLGPQPTADDAELTKKEGE